jgi:hypothetical protein
LPDSYEKRFTEDDFAGLPDSVNSVKFLHTLLCDAFGEVDEIVNYSVEPPSDRSQHFRFTISNTYRYGPFEFSFNVQQTDRNENESIVLRLDKVLAENEALKKSVLDTQQQHKQIQQQMEEMMIHMRYTRDLERFRNGVSAQVVLNVLAIIHDVPNTLAHWQRTRSFGGLDHAIQSAKELGKISDHDIQSCKYVQDFAKLCDAPSVTYRRVAHKALDVFEQHNGHALRSYHATANEKDSRGARIVHSLTRENATKVRVTLRVPEGVARKKPWEVRVQSVPGNHPFQCAVNAVANSLQETPQGIYNPPPAVRLQETVSVCPPALDGTTWTIKWNSVDQHWEVDSGASQMESCKYKTIDDIPAEYRARGVHFEYTVLEIAADDEPEQPS